MGTATGLSHNVSQPVMMKHNISPTLADGQEDQGFYLDTSHTGYHPMCPDQATIWWQPGIVMDQDGGPDAHKVVLKTTDSKRALFAMVEASRSELKRWVSSLCDNSF